MKEQPLYRPDDKLPKLAKLPSLKKWEEEELRKIRERQVYTPGLGLNLGTNPKRR